MKWFRLLRFKLAHLKWEYTIPYRMGDPALGRGEIRDQNRAIINARHKAQEPKPQDYGLDV